MCNAVFDSPEPFDKAQALINVSWADSTYVAVYSFYTAYTSVTIQEMCVSYQTPCFIQDRFIFEIEIQPGGAPLQHDNDFRTDLGWPDVAVGTNNQRNKVGFGFVPESVGGIGNLSVRMQHFNVKTFTMKKGDRLTVKAMRYDNSYTDDEDYGSIFMSYIIFGSQ
jgi:hypothetical protein